MEKNRCVRIATITLNQWAMDFSGNKRRIIDSLNEVKKLGSKIRIGPELEISGYSCEDHFMELDTIKHSWEVLSEIIKEGHTKDLLCDIGMPVEHGGIFYNCRIILYGTEILLVRPKMAMADDGNYRESRWFTAWFKQYVIEDFILPKVIQDINGQIKCKFGVAIIRANDLTYAAEICEELWAPYSPSVDFSMQGVDIIGNSSGSHFEIAKLSRRYELMVNNSKKNGGVYCYSNLIGCDGGRLYFDGGSFITINGKILSEGHRFLLNEMDIVSAVVDLDEVVSYRNGIKSRCAQSSVFEKKIPYIDLDATFCTKDLSFEYNPFFRIIPKNYTYEEEISHAPACWLWDYLRRSGSSGYFLALSGGSDSAVVATTVCLLTRYIFKSIVEGKSEFVLRELRKIIKDDLYYPKSSEEIANLLFITCYMGTEYSSKQTRNNAENLAKEIGAYHLNIDIDKIVGVFKETIIEHLKKEPKFESEGGTITEDLALQNIQARIRMCLSYLVAGLLNWSRSRKGYLLVLASANLDEGLMGYMTKYDCSSGDVNPIGSLSKIRLKKFLIYAHEILNIKSLKDILEIKPSAELRPGNGNIIQTDEEDLGVTYDELAIMGQLRKDYKCGPYSMFRRLIKLWSDKSTEYILDKVKLFFRRYAVNRHKMTTLTPSVHCESYSLDDNRFDLRQFLYSSTWDFQFDKISSLVDDISKTININ